MKKLFLLFMTLLLAFGINPVKAVPNIQKVYVPDIIISHDIDISNGIDAAVLVFDYTDTVGKNIRILYGEKQSFLNLNTAVTAYSCPLVFYTSDNMNGGLNKKLNKRRHIRFKNRLDYTYIGYSIKS